MSNSNISTFSELIAADPHQSRPDAVSFEKMDLNGQEIVLVNDGQFCWICDSEEFARTMDLVDPNAKANDWYSLFCSATSHVSGLEQAFEAEYGVRNWP